MTWNLWAGEGKKKGSGALRPTPFFFQKRIPSGHFDYNMQQSSML
jgi:hypothetical protein